MRCLNHTLRQQDDVVVRFRRQRLRQLRLRCVQRYSTGISEYGCIIIVVRVLNAPLPWNRNAGRRLQNGIAVSYISISGRAKRRNRQRRRSR